jgi:outer membrane receptor for ferrienterochelin and colicin
MVSAIGKAGPIVMVDGVQMMPDSSTGPNSSKSVLDKIDPNDIASISVFKGTEAVEIYGDKAKDGIIVITTKSQASRK